MRVNRVVCIFTQILSLRPLFRDCYQKIPSQCLKTKLHILNTWLIRQNNGEIAMCGNKNTNEKHEINKQWPNIHHCYITKSPGTTYMTLLQI